MVAAVVKVVVVVVVVAVVVVVFALLPVFETGLTLTERGVKLLKMRKSQKSYKKKQNRVYTRTPRQTDIR